MLTKLFKKSHSFKPQIKNSFHTTSLQLARSKTQGLLGKSALITGDFSKFTSNDKMLMQQALDQHEKVLVIVHDRNTISTPANQRARWIRKAFNDDPNLQVMVLYGVADLSEINLFDYSTQIKKILPQNLAISSIYCQHSYSPTLAGLLNTNHCQINLPRSNVIQEANSFKNPLKLPKYFSHTNTINAVKKHIEALNPADHPNVSTFFKRNIWDTEELGKTNLPVVIGKIENSIERQLFDSLDQVQVYDMPIYVPEEGLKIPEELAFLQSTLEKIITAERASNPKIDQCFWYVTFDSGQVAPDHFARRSGLHVDGFLTAANLVPEQDGRVYGDNTYIVCNDLGTEFYAGPFDLSYVNKNNAANVLKAFADQGKNMPYTQAEPYSIYKLTTNNVHAVHANDTGEYRDRNFLKVTFSIRPFNRLGSTLNPLLTSLKWQYVPRDIKNRNTQNYTGLCPVGYKDMNLSQIDFNKMTGPSWCGQFFQVRKNSNVVVSARPTKPGEYLETIVGNDLVTFNYAGEDDLQVTRSDKDTYYLARNEFYNLYKAIGSDKFSPKSDRLLWATKTSASVSFIAPWGTRQNLPIGSLIVHDGKKAWGVHQHSAEETYEKVDILSNRF